MPAKFQMVRSRGFSLIEVLVAVVVMSIGLLALASLQLNIIRASGEAKAAAAAAAIAKDQLESLRKFNAVEPDYRLINTSGWVTVADAGGLGGVVFQRQQEVSRWIYNKATSAFTNAGFSNTSTNAQVVAGCAQCLTSKDFKRVRVDVRWTDAAGVQRIISMEDLIDSFEPVESAKVVKANVGSSPRAVKVIIVNPGSVGGVIPIAIGDGTSTAASNPTPQVRGNSSAVAETRFDVFTYSAINGATAQAESRVETTVMHCTCSTANAPNDVNARGYRPTYWNGYRYAPPTLTSYAPPAGWTAVSSESLLCDSCCRDHNDPSGVVGPKFDPWRTAGHDHYRVTAAGTMTPAPTGTYDEACRMIRVDGLWRTAADLRDDYFAMLETNNSGTLTATDQNTRPYSPTTAAKDRYEDFVLDYLDDRISNNTVTTTYNTASAGTYPLNSGSYESTYQLNNPTSAIQLSPTAAIDTDNSKWLHTRGLYIDYLEPDAITAITDARTNCPDTSTQALRNACILPYMPFTSINLTELSDWKSGDPVNITDFRVVNGSPVDPNNENKPKRGNVYAGTNPGNNATGNILAHMSESNAGVAVFPYFTIDNDEQANFAAVSPSKGHDTQPFQIQGGGGGGGTQFYVRLVSAPNVTPPITVIGASPSSGSCDTSANPALCGINANGDMRLKVDGYTKASTASVPNGCKNTGSVNMPITLDYDISSAVNFTQANAPAFSITASNDGAVTDSTVVVFSTAINTNDEIRLTFNALQWWCPSNYNKQANNDSTGLNCSGPGNNTPTWSTTLVVCPSGTPGMP